MHFASSTQRDALGMSSCLPVSPSSTNAGVAWALDPNEKEDLLMAVQHHHNDADYALHHRYGEDVDADDIDTATPAAAFMAAFITLLVIFLVVALLWAPWRGSSASSTNAPSSQPAQQPQPAQPRLAQPLQPSSSQPGQTAPQPSGSAGGR